MGYEHVYYPQELKDLMARILNDQFMCENTRFKTFLAFQYSSAVFVNWNAEELVYRQEHLDYFVRESTCFPTWDAMVQAATDTFFTSEARTKETFPASPS